MPKKPRPPEEVEAFKQSILDAALELIGQDGYSGLTMRRLGKRLGMAAKTVYNYFLNQDEIYLNVLTKGFELLHTDLLTAYNDDDDPYERLKAMVDAWIDFGQNQSNYYDIMFTLYVPKYNDYVGSSLEPIAYKELQTALKNVNLFIKVFEEMAHQYGNIKPEDARLHFIELIVGLHGIISFYNNSILNYLHSRSNDIVKPIALNMITKFDPKMESTSSSVRLCGNQ